VVLPTRAGAQRGTYPCACARLLGAHAPRRSGASLLRVEVSPAHPLTSWLLPSVGNIGILQGDMDDLEKSVTRRHQTLRRYSAGKTAEPSRAPHPALTSARRHGCGGSSSR
jgi:hypothetical protein